MSDGSLSQDEIDALLQGGGGMDFGSETPQAPSGVLTDQELDTFAGLLGGQAGSQGSNLSGMFGKSVKVDRPTAAIVSRDELVGRLPPDIVEVRIDFSGKVSGSHSYVFPTETATIIAGLMMGQEGVELNDAALSAVEEAGNTMAGAAVTDLSERVGGSVATEPGQTHLGAREELSHPEESLVYVTYPLSIDGEPESEIGEVYSASLVSELVALLKPQPKPRGADRPAAGPGRPAPSASPRSPARASGGGAPQGFGGQLFGSPQGGGSPLAPQANVQAVQFPSLSGSGSGGDQGNIGLLMDVYMEMTVELGRTKKLIRDILGMGEGTIIELDKLAGEPVDILVNHKLIAKGEVVVIDENFGVRVTEIVSPLDRVSDM